MSWPDHRVPVRARGTAHALLREAEGQKIAGASADAREGGMSFLQKRKPEFKGN